MNFVMRFAQEMRNVSYSERLMTGLCETSELGLKLHMCSHYSMIACELNTITVVKLQT